MSTIHDSGTCTSSSVNTTTRPFTRARVRLRTPDLPGTGSSTIRRTGHSAAKSSSTEVVSSVEPLLTTTTSSEKGVRRVASSTLVRLLPM